MNGINSKHWSDRFDNYPGKNSEWEKDGKPRGRTYEQKKNELENGIVNKTKEVLEINSKNFTV